MNLNEFVKKIRSDLRKFAKTATDVDGDLPEWNADFEDFRKALDLAAQIKLNKKLAKKSGFLICDSCEVADATVTRGPDPYASDINGDYTDRDMCGNCRHESAMDI